jgi:hypothetical protein
MINKSTFFITHKKDGPHDANPPFFVMPAIAVVSAKASHDAWQPEQNAFCLVCAALQEAVPLAMRDWLPLCCQYIVC